MIRFEHETFYTEEALRVLGLDSKELARARQEGTLRCRQVGRVRLYKGIWLHEWLSGSEEGDRRPSRDPSG